MALGPEFIQRKKVYLSENNYHKRPSLIAATIKALSRCYLISVSHRCSLKCRSSLSPLGRFEFQVALRKPFYDT